jgi:hypothetical protein
MNTDQIIEIFRTHSVDAARLGFNVIVLPEDEWLHIAEHLSQSEQGYSEAEVVELLRQQREKCARAYLDNFKNHGILNAPEPPLKSSLKT